jgi:hypothetical protein
MNEGGKVELPERMCTRVVGHSFRQLPDSDQRSERIDLNNPGASSTVANGKNTVEIMCGSIILIYYNLNFIFMFSIANA